MDSKNNKSIIPMLGIIAGGGRLPLEIAAIHLKQGGGLCIAALDGEADLELFKALPYQLFKIGNVEAVIEYFREFGIKNIIFAGSVTRPNLKSIKVDLAGSKLIASILAKKFLGDDNVLKVVANFFENKGFKVISVQDILAANFNHNKTIKSPSKQDLIDIELGVKVIEALSVLDIGQAVIVEDGYVIGIEAAEGTDNLIKRCANLRKKSSGGVLIKMMKLEQDTRMDIPAIGSDTISNLASLQYNGVAIQKNGVIIIEPEHTLKLADELGVFLVPHRLEG